MPTLESAVLRTGLVAAALFLASCADSPAPAGPSATATLRPTSTVSLPTLIPTASLTPAPSPSPTPSLLTELGAIAFDARFTDGEGWALGSDTGGGASLSSDSLVLAVSLPNASRYVLAPAPPVADFLLEASLRASLCTGADEIGVMFRVSPQGDHYRFTLDCQGDARVTRVTGGVAVSLAGPLDVPGAIPGAPARNHLSVLGRSDSFTFLVNGEQILTLRDPLLPSGLVGFFVRSSSQGQTTAALTALRLWTLLPAATAAPSG